ncbi:Exocyst complex component 5 [Lamellibrachia satsuma]|nr:Exocyst complex component 5 [Lamellibrachia satsuma]
MALQELEQDPFDAIEFVERLAWRTSGGTAKASEFDPMVLHGVFEQTIEDLKEMRVRIQRHVQKVEASCKDEEKVHWQKVAELQKHNQAAFSHFQALDERINFVATKVVHLGDQLEGVNTPRTRAAEAQMLMRHFAEFMEVDGPKSVLFTELSKQLQLAADIIQKLHLIVQELPMDTKFNRARSKISAKYEEIETCLIDEFREAFHKGDRRKMKRTAAVLSHFKGYSQCIDIFIEESQVGAFMSRSVFEDIPPLCAKTSIVINEVFSRPEMVMCKFVLNLYHGKLQEHISTMLSDTRELETYLRNLYDLYTKASTLSEQLSAYKLGNDSSFLNKVTKNIFSRYLEDYISIECRFLKERCTAVLQRYYDSRHHQKKNIQSGGIHVFRRDLQAVIGTKANLNLGPTIENYDGETFLSQEVTINLLQESKLAFKRCNALSARSDLPENATKIFELLVQFLVTEHIDYALELGLQAIPLADPKKEPEIYFFDVVCQANTIFHLFEKQFSDNLLPLVTHSAKHSDCLQKKRDLMETMENKLDMGLDRTVAAIIGWIKYTLTTEQKKIDFKPDSEEGPIHMYSQACEKVVKYLSSQVDSIRFSLDGKNVDAVLMEIGMRSHRVIYDHLLQFQYNSMGAMLAICDVNEYRKAVKDFNISLVTQLFDTLHALCNLLLVVPDNLKQVCTGEQLAGLDKAVLLSFVQLRADFKTSRLATLFK